MNGFITILCASRSGSQSLPIPSITARSVGPMPVQHIEPSKILRGLLNARIRRHSKTEDAAASRQQLGPHPLQVWSSCCHSYFSFLLGDSLQNPTIARSLRALRDFSLSARVVPRRFGLLSTHGWLSSHASRSVSALTRPTARRQMCYPWFVSSAMASNPFDDGRTRH